MRSNILIPAFHSNFAPTSQPALYARAHELLRQFLDFTWEKTVADRAFIDMQVVVPRAAFLQLLDEKSTESRAEGERCYTG